MPARPVAKLWLAAWHSKIVGAGGHLQRAAFFDMPLI
jgi:hypothetical protein